MFYGGGRDWVDQGDQEDLHDQDHLQAVDQVLQLFPNKLQEDSQ